jgi:hypothetical protein
MSTSFMKDLLECAGDEPILTVKIISSLDEGYREPDPRNKGIEKFLDKCVPWDEVKYFLDYPYDEGYGESDCHFLYAWTPTFVIHIHEYDGSTRPESIPRNPD